MVFELSFDPICSVKGSIINVLWFFRFRALLLFRLGSCRNLETGPPGLTPLLSLRCEQVHEIDGDRFNVYRKNKIQNLGTKKFLGI
jgi:hypothetical protein